MPDALGAPAAPGKTGNEDDALLNADDSIGEPQEDVQDEDETPEEDTDSKDDNEEDPDAEPPAEDSDDDDKKPAIPFDRPTVKELREAYPDIFKKFPSLRDAYFREIEFTKLFPSVEDAKEAVDENAAFSSMSDAALDGDPVPILDSLGKTDKKAFTLFAAGFLPALYKQDKETYHEIITPVVENIFRNAYKSPDEETRKAAILVAKFIFDEDGEAIATGKKTLSRIHDLTKEQTEIKERRAQETSVMFKKAYGEINTQIETGLGQLILKQIDPNNAFSPFVRKQLSAETVKRIYKQLESDAGHMSVMQQRWKKAKSSGYSDSDKSKIISTFLARAKSLIPATSEKVRSLAMGKSDAKGPVERVHPKRENNGGRPAGHSGNGKGQVTKEAMRKMTDMQILEME